MFASTESPHWVFFVRHIDVRGWKLKLKVYENDDEDLDNVIMMTHIRFLHTQCFRYICKHGIMDTVRAIVERMTVDLKVPSDEDDNTPLRLASFNGHISVVQYLCEKGADKEARDRDDNTPLHCAASEGHLSVMQ